LAVAIIQNGTKSTQKKVIGTISSIAKLVEEQQMASPSIIVIGEVVKNISKLTSYFKNENEMDDFIFQNLNISE
jgi:uroporphyrin-III C-methyltransferase